jgi:signal peptidase I
VRKKLLILSLIGVLLSVALLVGYRLFFLKMVIVPTGAMANTIIPGDRLVVKRTWGGIARGDLVVFRYPKQPEAQYIARVIGLPGESIQVRDDLVFIDGNEIQERRVFVKQVRDFEDGMLEERSSEGSGPYSVFYFLRDQSTRALLGGEPNEVTFGTRWPFKIPDQEYFVMGDNRDNSYDSRFQGTVPRQLIWGKPTVIYWSSHSNAAHKENVRWERMWTKVK